MHKSLRLDVANAIQALSDDMRAVTISREDVDYRLGYTEALVHVWREIEAILPDYVITPRV